MRYFAALALIFCFCGLLTPAAFMQEEGFSDINHSPYKASIEYLYARNIVQGYSGRLFRPEKPLNRAEMIKILIEANFPADAFANHYNCFTDVEAQWYAKYICTAKEKGIVSGYPAGDFKPAQAVNMAEGLKIALESFSTVIERHPGQAWYEHYLDFAHQNNLFSLYDYLPSRPMTRGEMTFLVHQLFLNKSGEKPFTGIRKNWSMGCGKTPPSTPPQQSIVEGKKRTYITVIPSDYDEDEAKQLIFAFHGRTNPNTQVRTYYGVEQASDGEAILIYPAGLPTGPNSRGWSDPGDAPHALRDFALFDQLLKEFSSQYCIDLDEVYVVAHSLGAWFANSLACFRGDVIRGVGTVGGGTTLGNCTGPVAVMIWHNPKDNLVPYSAGLLARDQYLKQNRCSQATIPAKPSQANCVEYRGCYEGAPVVWCPHTIDYDRDSYYPHTWPRFAGPSIWSFLQDLNKP